MRATVQPVYVGTLNDKPLRFYPPQSDDDMMPWVAMDDLLNVLPLNYTTRRKLLRAYKQLRAKFPVEFPNVAKRIPTTDGNTLVVGFQAVGGLMSAFEEVGLSVEAVYDAFTSQIINAVKRHSPLLFDHIDGEKLILNSRILAALLGKDHDEIANRMREFAPDEVKAVLGPTGH